MSFRIEEKLMISIDNLIEFKDFLFKKKAKILYPNRKIKSLYFENHNNEMYSDSIEGLLPRKKIRVREYPNEENKVFYYEVKISSEDGRFKKRKIINKKDYEELKDNGIFDQQYGLCKPLMYVIYDREYYLIDDVRISIDRNINYTSYFGSNLGSDQQCAVELKASINKSKDQLLNNFPFQRQRFSKYCNGVEKKNSLLD
jgi:hypothetical protein